jgi:hypothetical protein
MAKAPNPPLLGEPPAGDHEARRPHAPARVRARRLLVAFGALGLVVAAVLLGAWTGVLGGLLARTPWAPAPAYGEVVHAVYQPVLGRDFVIPRSDATPDRIEWLVATIAADDPSTLLRINVFTSEAAALRRRELIAQNIYAHDEDEPEPPEWTAVHRDWVGIYTRDPLSAVHQLSICLDDPQHDHCTVRRYPTARQ